MRPSPTPSPSTRPQAASPSPWRPSLVAHPFQPAGANRRLSNSTAAPRNSIPAHKQSRSRGVPSVAPSFKAPVAAAAGAGSIVSDTVNATSTEQVPMQVTRHNFAAVLPTVRKALSECQFYSFDCEMTGLFPAGQSDEYFDDYEDRYLKLQVAAQQFLVIQFGLSAFSWDPTAGHHVAKTFNFYIFPAPHEAYDRRFTCQASSLEFLASQGFDFNKFIYEGIPFLQLRYVRDKRLREQQQDKLDASRLARAPSDPSSSQAVQQDVAGFSVIFEMMRDCGRPAVGHNLVYDLAFSLQQFVEPLPRTWPEYKALVNRWFKSGVYDTKYLAKAISYNISPNLDAFNDTALGSLYAKMLELSKNDAAVEQLVWRNSQPVAAAATASYLPAAANGSVAGLAALVQVQPSDERGATAGSSGCSRQLLPAVEHAAGFGDYLDTSPAAAAATAQTYAANGTAAAVATSAAAHPSSSSSSSSSSKAHEAGYDAFMTGTVFAGLVKLAELHAAGPPGKPTSHLRTLQSPTPIAATAANTQHTPAAGALPSPTLQYVEPYIGRQHIMYSDLPHYDLIGSDPVPSRPNVFYITNLRPFTRPGEIQGAFQAAGLGRVRVALTGTQSSAINNGGGSGSGIAPGRQQQQQAPQQRGALVEVASEYVAKVIPTMRKESSWRILKYADYYYNRKQANMQAPASPRGHALPKAPLQLQQGPAPAAPAASSLPAQAAAPSSTTSTTSTTVSMHDGNHPSGSGSSSSSSSSSDSSPSTNASNVNSAQHLAADSSITGHENSSSSHSSNTAQQPANNSSSTTTAAAASSGSMPSASVKDSSADAAAQGEAGEVSNQAAHNLHDATPSAAGCTDEAGQEACAAGVAADAQHHGAGTSAASGSSSAGATSSSTSSTSSSGTGSSNGKHPSIFDNGTAAPPTTPINTREASQQQSTPVADSAQAQPAQGRPQQEQQQQQSASFKQLSEAETAARLADAARRLQQTVGTAPSSVAKPAPVQRPKRV